MRFVTLLLFAMLFVSCTTIRVIPGSLSPIANSRQIWSDGVCYLTADSSSIAVKSGVIERNSSSIIFKIEVENKKKQRVQIRPSDFSYQIMDSLQQTGAFGGINAINAEQSIASITSQLASLEPPSQPYSGPIELIIGIIDIFSKDTPEKQKRQEEEANQRQREEIEYQSKMLAYQQNYNKLTARKLELENFYLKTNDLDSAKCVQGKVEFPTPFRYTKGAFLKMFIPVDGTMFSFIYNFKPDRYIEVK